MSKVVLIRTQVGEWIVGTTLDEDCNQFTEAITLEKPIILISNGQQLVRLAYCPFAVETEFRFDCRHCLTPAPDLLRAYQEATGQIVTPSRPGLLVPH